MVAEPRHTRDADATIWSVLSMEFEPSSARLGDGRVDGQPPRRRFSTAVGGSTDLAFGVLQCGNPAPSWSSEPGLFWCGQT